MQFSNIYELLIDMRLHGSDSILCADISPTYGWVCQKTEKVWRITLSDAAKSLILGDENSIKIIREHFSLPKNRQEIVQLLNNLPILERLTDLKAFW